MPIQILIVKMKVSLVLLRTILYDFGILCKITKSEQTAMYNVLATAFNGKFKESANI